MKTLIVWGLLILAAAVVQDVKGQTPAEPCNPETCKAPECRCSSTDIPGDIRARSVPQLVMLTFDDAVNVLNIETYRRLLYNRRNSNNCPIGATFYVSHEYSNYQAINELYNNGFEIALHSISHVTDQEYWRDATYETLVSEFIDQRVLMSHFANIPQSAMQGVRMPFLQMAGDAQFIMMANNSLLYDASMPTSALVNPGLWPYTLHYRSIQECIIPPCASSSIPGPWVLPLLTWTDLNNFPCSFVDACIFRPPLNDENAWLNFILKNFETHYTGNRAPFGFYVHEGFIRANPAVERALTRFMNIVNSLPDAFMVNAIDVVEWVRNPVPLEEYRNRSCRTFLPTPCVPSNCGPLLGLHNGNSYFMQACNSCPAVYPWLGNPLGRAP